MTNIVLVTIDSLRADHLGYYGYDRETSPVIDSLAADGLSFDAYANSSWTRASFPSIITSTYPLEFGGFEYLSDQRTTVGSVVSEGDYETAAFHSNLWLSRDYNYGRGFDQFYDSKTDPSLLAKLRAFVKLNLDDDGIVYRTLQRLYDVTEEKAGVDVGQTYKDAETITDEAIEWIESTTGDFFVWVHYMDVHHPYVPHSKISADLGIDPGVSEREAIQLRRKMLEEPEEISDDEYQTLVDLYDTEIRYTDTHIGRLIDVANQHGGDEDTAVVLTSDHGDEFREHGQFSHTPTMYDEVLHVPIIVSGADVKETGHQDEQVELLDIAPTVADLADVPTPDSYRGRSLLAAAGSGEDVDVISETWQNDEYKLSVRTPEWKYIWDRDAGVRELYHLASDPDETQNVINDQPDIADNLQERLREHLEELRETNETLPNVSMDNETEARLKDLGYLE
ncbi:sulfatase [Halorhabdus sp. BNX81]|uniref:sulfatase n=1 Tax=Halorhabdus sp. BNX81 TaxID=2980181 RepID=UPI0023DD3B14|nr:sulfatase [Halorhabdus sp. BNX81]WEL21113.1 Arylsulfatase A [Halorhabdus sp. BNX81]